MNTRPLDSPVPPSCFPFPCHQQGSVLGGGEVPLSPTSHSTKINLCFPLLLVSRQRPQSLARNNQCPLLQPGREGGCDPQELSLSEQATPAPYCIPPWGQATSSSWRQCSRDSSVPEHFTPLMATLLALMFSCQYQVSWRINKRNGQNVTSNGHFLISYRLSAL